VGLPFLPLWNPSSKVTEPTRRTRSRGARLVSNSFDYQLLRSEVLSPRTNNLLI
jgi:hypothetical protein